MQLMASPTTGPSRPNSGRGSFARFWLDGTGASAASLAAASARTADDKCLGGHDKSPACCYIACMPRVEFIEGASDKAIAEWIAQRLKAALATTPDDIAITVP